MIGVVGNEVDEFGWCDYVDEFEMLVDKYNYFFFDCLVVCDIMGEILLVY